MDWDDLRFVLAAARSGSFLGASERLKVAHTTVGRRINALERDLRQPLFKRTRDGVIPTEFCDRILPTAEAMEAHVMGLSLEGATESQDPEGMVRVHTAAWIIEHVLIPGLPEFQRANPKVQLHFVGDVVDSITDRSVPSISIRAEVMPKRDEVEVKLIDIPLSVYCLAGSDPVDLPWITSHGGKMRISQLKWMEARGVGVEDITVLFNDAELVRAALVTGAFQGLLAHFLARLSPELVRVHSGRADLMRTYRCITQRRTLAHREVQAVLDWIKTTVPASGAGEI